MGTLACIVLAFALDGYSFQSGRWEVPIRWYNNILIPIVVAPPFFYFLLSKLRELSLAHRELLTVASTDPLTNCLNRRAFTALVDGYLSKFDDSTEKGQGALLVLDVDHFKDVNDRYGHDCGDQALILIADTIKASVREPDLVASGGRGVRRIPARNRCGKGDTGRRAHPPGGGAVAAHAQGAVTSAFAQHRRRDLRAASKLPRSLQIR